MKIIALIEDTAVNEKLFYEHGVSFYVELGGRKYLIDAGASDKVVENALRMRIDLSQINSIMITHNHLSHIGGLESVMKRCPNAKIFMKAAAQEEYFEKNGFFNSSAGVHRQFFRKYAKNFILFNRFSEVCENFYAASNEVLDEKLMSPDKSLFMKKNGKTVPDDYNHECFAVIFPKEKKKDGLVLITGCNHIGIGNVIKTVQERWHDIPILAVIGGFHTMGSSPKTLNCTNDFVINTARELKYSSAEKIYTCHCTGYKAFDMMDEVLGDRLLYIGGGEELEF